LTAGQSSDFPEAIPLLSALPFQFVLADKGYDSNEIVTFIHQQQGIAVIPPKANRKIQRGYDKHLYKERNLVERFFNKAKHFRRMATRYEKTARNYLAMLTLVATVLWLR